MFRKRGKKAQAAMEFLMTYGWAILIILIALGVLFYLGVFNPRTPSTCIAAAPLSCTDVKATGAGAITLVLGASAVQSASVDTTVGLNGLTITTPAGVAACGAPAPSATVSTSAPSSIIWSSCTGLSTNAKIAGTATVTYRLLGSDQDHTTTVQFSGQVE